MGILLTWHPKRWLEHPASSWALLGQTQQTEHSVGSSVGEQINAGADFWNTGPLQLELFWDFMSWKLSLKAQLSIG